MLLVRVPDSQLNEPCPESAESSSQPHVLFITVDFYTARAIDFLFIYF
jgi:hypothetical protein